jgi:uncharacterized membrane protein
MTDAKFSINEALKYGWETFKAKAGFFIGLVVVLALVTIVPDYIVGRLFEQGSALRVIFTLIIRLFGLFLGMITTRISLDLYDTGETDLSKIGGLLSQFLPYLGGKIIYGIMVLIGMVLLIIPGIIVSYMFLYVGYLIVDRQLGPIEALKESKVITDGSKWHLFLFSMVIALLNIIGAVCLGVGLLITIPVTLMASVYVYRQLSPSQVAVAA